MSASVDKCGRFMKMRSLRLFHGSWGRMVWTGMVVICLIFLMIVYLKHYNWTQSQHLTSHMGFRTIFNTSVLKRVWKASKDPDSFPVPVSTHPSESAKFDDEVWRPKENMPIIHKDAKILINPIKLCSPINSQDVFLLVLILSSTGHVKQRDNIRQTYGSVTSYKSRPIRHVFLLAEPKDENQQSRIKAESILHGDIVQFGFMDTYRNLSMKTSSGLVWAKRFCPRAKFILKTDDDYMVLPGRMVDYFDHISSEEERVLYSGYVVNTSPPIRAKSSKYYASWIEYPYRHYPPYVTGAGIMMSNNVLNLFRDATRKVPRTPSEDVYLGLLAKMSNITPKANFERIKPDIPNKPSNLPEKVLVFKAPLFEITKKIWSKYKSA